MIESKQTLAFIPYALMFRTTLPYFADSETIPTNLPPVDEIESSQDVLCDHSVRKLEGVGQNFIASDGGQDVFSFDSERAFTKHSRSSQ